MTRTTKADGSRTYTIPNEDGTTDEYPSVTTILQVVAKPALTTWAANSVARYAVDNHDTITDLLNKDDRDGAYRLLKGSPWAKRDKAAGTGTDTHALIERLILGEELEPSDYGAEAPYLRAFLSFVSDHPNSTFEASEMTVFSRTHRFAGTLDALMAHGDRVGAVDWKTRGGKRVEETKVYETERLQVAAYMNAEFALLPDGSVERLPLLDGGSIVMLCVDGYKVERVESGDFAGFLAARELFKWKEGA